MTSLRFGAPVILGASALLLAAAAASAASQAETPAATVVVYDQPDFKGRALTLSAATPDLGPLGFDNKVASLAIQGGDWVLCENKNYGGRCVRVQRQAGDLGLLQLSGRVSSLYPVPATSTPVAKP